MLKVIDFINSHENWREILSGPPYHISIKDDEGFTILKYSQINSDFSNEIVRECRGLIIDEKLNPVCIPFFRFANFGESYADEIDWTTAIVEEKIDGSLLKVWSYEGKWIVSTNGTIFASKAIIGSEDEIKTESSYGSFGDLFTDACNLAGLRLNKLNPQNTYMFELISPYATREYFELSVIWKCYIPGIRIFHSSPDEICNFPNRARITYSTETQ